MTTTYQKRRWFARRPYTTKWYIHSKPAVIGGVAAGLMETALIVRDGNSVGWTMEHAAAPVLVFLAILCAHNAWQAFRELKLLSCVGLGLCAVFFSGLIVMETTKRRADTRESINSERTFDADKQAALVDDFKKARKLAEQAAGWMAGPCKRNPNGDACKTHTFTFNQRQAHADKLRAEVSGIKATAPVEPGLSVLAGIVAKAGYDKKMIADAIRIADQIALPIGLQFASIFLFGFGVRHRKVYEVIEAAKAVEVEAPKMLSFESENGDRPSKEIDELKRLFGKLEEILAKAGELNNQELAFKAGFSPGHMSRLRQKLEGEGRLRSRREGKETLISLATSEGKRVAA